MKTEQEKIAMCILFLEKRGYAVAKPTMITNDVAALLGVSEATVSRFITLGSPNYRPDFPRPLKVGGQKGRHRFSGAEIVAWAEKHCEVAK